MVPGADAPEIFMGPETTFGRVFTTRSPYGLWVTDGTELGTEQVLLPPSFATSVRSMFALRDGRALFFPTGGPHLRITDGTVDGTVELAGPGFTSATPLLELDNGRVLFYDGQLQLPSTLRATPECAFFSLYSIPNT